MSCNHCATASTGAAKLAGAPEVEAHWGANRAHPQYCPICHAFLRADGGAAGAKIRAYLLTAVFWQWRPLPSPVYLSGGHRGKGQRCTGCDDWAVAGKAGTKKFSLFGINLTWANLREARLNGAFLAGATLSNATPDRSKIQRPNEVAGRLHPPADAERNIE